MFAAVGLASVAGAGYYYYTRQSPPLPIRPAAELPDLADDELKAALSAVAVTYTQWDVQKLSKEDLEKISQAKDSVILWNQSANAVIASHKQLLEKIKLLDVVFPIKVAAVGCLISRAATELDVRYCIRKSMAVYFNPELENHGASAVEDRALSIIMPLILPEDAE